MKLKIAEDLSLPLDVATEKLAWLGRTGSGKTYGAMKLAELLLAAGVQVGAIDPVGVWRALRVPAAKGGTSFEVVVFGGLYGDLPLEPSAGELIANLVVERGLSFVLDVSQFIPSEQQRFVRAFADRFFHLKKATPSAVHLFMEECQEFIPENPSGAEAQTLGVMQRLWKLGRNFGIGGSLISQRPQEIAKKALNMSGTLFAFQMTGPQERKAIRAWVADHGVAIDIESVLQKLEVGQPHVESPMFLELSKTVRILPRVTADLSSTPKVGIAGAAKRSLTPIDVEQLKASLTATIEKAKADDPVELRKQLAEANRMLVRQEKAIADLQAKAPAGRERIVEKPVLKDAHIVALDKQLGRVEAAIEKAATLLGKPIAGVKEQIAELATAIKSVRQPPLPMAAPRPPAPRPRLDDRLGTDADKLELLKARFIKPAPADSSLTPAEQRILNALAFLHGIGVELPAKNQVALVADASPNGGAYQNNLSALRTAGYIDYPQPGSISLTDLGRSTASAEGIPTTSADLHVLLERKFQPAQWRIVRALIDAYPEALAKAELAERASASAGGGAFQNNVSALRTFGLLDYPQPGYVQATPVLFLEGR